MNRFKNCFCLISLFGFICHLVDCASNDTLVTFTQAWSNSVQSDTAQNERECRASNALQRGTNMWCSKEIASNTDVVTWTGLLKEERVVKGIRIHWGSSPGKYMIEISPDGTVFKQIVQWKDNARKNEENFSEDILFPDKYTVTAVRVSMQEATFRRFGINFLALLPSGQTLVMLTSGMTSPQGELCLQAEQRNFGRGTAIVVDKCTYAIQMGDGRELFMLTDSNQILHSMSRLCVTLKDNNVEDGGDIILDDCSILKHHGENQWEVLYDNRLRILRQGDFCLSQQGDRAGKADIALDKMVQSNFPRYHDEEYSAEKAVDGDPQTFWLSQEFDYPYGLPPDVEFSIDLGGNFKLVAIETLWHSPAACYSISLSNDGEKFIETKKVIGNFLNMTTDVIEGTTARYIRVNMLQPHPKYSVSNNKAVFGIFEISVWANRLKTVVGPCDEVVLSKDARDKYFATFVPEFDAYPGNKKIQQEKDFLDIKESLLAGNRMIDDTFERLKLCAKNIQQHQQRSVQLTNSIEKLGQAVSLAEKKFILESISSSQGLLSNLTLFDGEDCDDIFSNNPASFSGFYNIKSSCDMKPKRVYCERQSHRTIYFNPLSLSTPVTELRQDIKKFYTPRMQPVDWTPSDIPKICQQVNMQPFVPQNSEDLTLLQKLLTLIRHNTTLESNDQTEALYPIAFFSEDPENRLLGLDLITDLRDTFKNIKKKLITTEEAIAISGISLELKSIQWSVAPISGVFCTLESPGSNYKNSILNITCDVVARNNPLFESCPYTSIMIRCIESCVKKINEGTNDLEINVFGTNIYRDDSSICAAAQHNGALGKHGVVNVTFLPGYETYDGSFSNGIRSQTYNGALWDRSFQVSRPADRCDKKEIAAVPQGSFLQLHEHYVTSNNNLELLNRKMFFTSSAQTDDEVKFLLLGSQLDTRDDMVQQIADITKEKIEEFRSVLKPSEVSQAELQEILNTLEHDTSRLLDSIYRLEDRTIKRLDALSTREAELNTDKNIAQNGYTSFYFKDFIQYLATGLEHDFVIETHPLIFTSEIVESLDQATQFPDIYDGRWSIAPIENRELASLQGHHTALLSPLEYSLQYTPKSMTNVKFPQESLVQEKNRVFQAYESLVFFDPPLYIKNKRIYDGQLSLNFMIAEGDGSFCIGFRVRDPTNMYILEIKQNKGMKRVIRVSNGVPVILATKHDGGYINSVWYTVTIMLNRDIITISIGKFGSAQQLLFKLMDSSHTSGAIGFFARHARPVITDIKFLAFQCHRSDVPPAPPFPDSCSSFTYAYVENFNYHWRVVDPPQYLTASSWAVNKHVSGREKVIVQYNSVYGTEDHFGTLAILKRHRFCRNGLFSFDFFPQCNGIVGAILHYGGPYQWVIAEIGRDFVRVRYISPTKENKNGWSFHDVVQVSSTTYTAAKFLSDQWNTLLVDFFNTTIGIHLNGQPIFFTQLPNSKILPANGRVGLSTWNCGGVAFDRIQLKPRELFPAKTNDSFKGREVNPLLSEKNVSLSVIPGGLGISKFSANVCTPTASCLASHISDRRNDCRILRDISRNDEIMENWNFNSFRWIDATLFPCVYNYCAECCEKRSEACTDFLIKVNKTFQGDSLLLGKLNSLKSKCLQECSKYNGEAQSSAEALWRRINMCKYSYEEIFGLTLPSEISTKTSCIGCCNSDEDVKIQSECRRYCSPREGFSTVYRKSINSTAAKHNFDLKSFIP